MNPVSVSTDEVSVVRTFIHQVPMHFNSAVEQPAVEQFTGAVQDMGAEDNAVVIDKLQRLALEA